MLLVGDIGGTHARFALAESDGSGSPIIHDEQKFVCAEFAGVEEAMECYLDQAQANFTRECVSLAVAGPVTRQSVSFTNTGWNVSAKRICEQLHFERAVLLNDLEAVVRAWPHLRGEDLEDLFHEPKLGGTQRHIRRDRYRHRLWHESCSAWPTGAGHFNRSRAYQLRTLKPLGIRSSAGLLEALGQGLGRTVGIRKGSGRPLPNHFRY